jgi:uncharacterized membrane protein YsdA (DUF1294 family)/cold shock CspA family protein
MGSAVRRRTGVLAEWNDQRGFGFVEAGGTRTFVHISAFGPADGRPQAGEFVEFAIGKGPDGRPCAVSASRLFAPAGRQGQRAARRAGVGRVAFAPVVGFAILLVVVISVLRLPFWWVTYYLVMSAFTFLLYSWDKRAAIAGTNRTPERTLHLAALLGGWPGAVLAQQSLRHKNRKESFQFRFWLAALANVAVFIVVTVGPHFARLGPG